MVPVGGGPGAPPAVPEAAAPLLAGPPLAGPRAVERKPRLAPKALQRRITLAVYSSLTGNVVLLAAKSEGGP